MTEIERIPEWVQLRAAAHDCIPVLVLGDRVELVLISRSPKQVANAMQFGHDFYCRDPDACWESLMKGSLNEYNIN